MKKRVILPIICALLLLSSCSENLNREITFTGMDTVMTLRACGKKAQEAIADAKNEILRLENELNALDDGSCIAGVNKNGGGAVTEDAQRVISTAVEVSRRTDGAFDVTVAPVMELWSFDTGGVVPSEGDVSAALGKVDYRNIRISGNNVELLNGAQIDLGGIAKGYAGDIFGDIMAEYGIESAMAYLGGNVVLVGSKPDGSLWRVAVQDPRDETGRIGIISARDCSIVTSGGYQRYFECDGEVYHHIIDPETGYSAESGIISATAVGEGGAVMDGLSTALFVMGEEAAVELWRTCSDFEMVLVTDDGRVLVTDGLSFEEQDSGYVYERIER